MEYRELGRSQLSISAVSFGAGPISGLMVGDDQGSQRATVAQALQAGINWFDTAATYGGGTSEAALGDALAATNASDTHIATKVRLAPEQLDDIPRAVRDSFDASLQRLGVDRVTLLQLHNSVTASRGDLPTSITVEDVLGNEGVVGAFEDLRSAGRVDHFGFTGLGSTRSITGLVRSHVFTSAQVPLNLLTPIAGEDRSAGSIDVDYEALVDECAAHGVGVIAIRLFAGGALVGQEPAPHTYKTKFFSLDLFQRDQQRAARLRQALADKTTLAEASIRYVLGKPGVSTALIGFASPAQVSHAVDSASKGPLTPSTLQRLMDAREST